MWGMESNEEAEYRQKLTTTATTLAEKMNVLDTRDKLMRLKRSRQTNLATAVAVVGTCPDMCPELERYFRQETNQMSFFESDSQSGQPDEYRMLKEYRRSGADQEEPLPHELRPVPVLNRTMDYLCTNIIDDLDPTSGCGEWYDFVWSRTRSIRKDITQQHLCNEEAVALTEKCARFHIYCSATLCEQDLKQYDPKINEENLSNCLQTLKDMYYDLSLRDIYCPNEAEFRCYEVLLHLNDSSVMKDVQNYRKAIRDSEEVRLAVKALLSFQSNNYYHFFKLLNQCSYLMSCALHRYFILMRQKALKIIRKSFTSNASSSQEYPIELLLNNLGFDEEEEVRDFCFQMDLQCNEQSVRMVRGGNLQNAIKAKRSIRLVEAKRTTLVGEVIYGSALPPNPYKKFPLHNSFDSEGRLTNNAFDATDQKVVTVESQMPDLSVPPSTPIPINSSQLDPIRTPDESSKLFNAPPAYVPSQIWSQSLQSMPTQSFDIKPTESPSFDIPNDICNSISSELFEDGINDYLVDICEEELDEMIRQDIIHHLYSSILDDTCDDMIQEVTEEVLIEEMNIKLEEVAKELMNNMLNDFVLPQIEDISRQTLSEVRQQSIDKVNESIANELLHQMIGEVIEDISLTVLSFEAHLIKSKIETIKANRVRRLEVKYFTKWRDWFIKAKRVRHLKQSFPAAPKWGSVPGISPEKKSIVKHWFDSSDDEFQKSIERELKANSKFNAMLYRLIKEIASELFNCVLSQRSPLFEHIRQKRVKRLQHKYGEKWKQFVLNKRLANKRKALPAAPLWTPSKSRLSNTSFSSQTNHSFFESNIESDLEVLAKKFRPEVTESHFKESQTEDQISPIKPLFEKELSESKKLTQRLAQELMSGPSIESLNTSITESEDVFDDEENEMQVIEVFETQTDKMNRLKRLLSEEKDYFSLHNFVQYLADNEPPE